MVMLGQDSFELLSAQSYALERLQQGERADTGRLHLNLQYDYHGNKALTDHATGLRARYGINDNLTLGVGYDHSVRRQLPDSYKNNHDSGNIGVYARYTHHHPDGSETYLQPALAYNRYQADIRRPVLSNTEATHSPTTVQGQSYSLTLGQERQHLGWHSSIRHSHISRKGYRESGDFPISYGDIALKDTSLALGIHSNYPLNSKLSLQPALEIEQRLGGSDPTYSAQGDYIGNFSHTVPLNRTRGKAQVSVKYQINDDMRISLTPSLSKDRIGEAKTGANLNFEARF